MGFLCYKPKLANKHSTYKWQVKVCSALWSHVLTDDHAHHLFKVLKVHQQYSCVHSVDC